MKRLLHWLVGAPVALAAILLSVANRGPVTFSLDPFTTGEPALAVELPLFVLLFAAIFVGLVAGWLIGWWGTTLRRREARQRETPPQADRNPADVSGARALLPRH